MIDQYLVNLETSIKLADYLTKDYRSNFIWHTYNYSPYSDGEAEKEITHELGYRAEVDWNPYEECFELDHHIKNSQLYNALTFDDIYNMLPQRIASSEMTDRESVMSSCNYLHSLVITPYYIFYESTKYGVMKGSMFSHRYPDKEISMATACAQLYIWLKDNGLIDETNN